jgi:hypothetical protein
MERFKNRTEPDGKETVGDGGGQLQTQPLPFSSEKSYVLLGLYPGPLTKVRHEQSTVLPDLRRESTLPSLSSPPPQQNSVPSIHNGTISGTPRLNSMVFGYESCIGAVGCVIRSVASVLECERSHCKQ